MKIDRKDGSPERQILIHMITDNSVCGRIANKWSPELFKSKWSSLVASWCVKYFLKYDKAPGKAVKGMFDSWASKSTDSDTVALVERFLGGLSDEYEETETNSAYVVDEAAEYFRKTKLQKLADKLQGHLDSDELEEAQKEVDNFTQIQLGTGSGIDLLSDKEAIKRAFETRRDPVIVYPDALGNFFGNSLYRGAFVSLEGPEKRAKTFWLLDMAWRAMKQKRKVAFFEVGDLTESDIILRFMTRAARRPLYATKGNDDESLNHPIQIPTFIERDQSARIASVDFEEQFFPKPLDWQSAVEACKKITEKQKTKESRLKVCTEPADSVSVRDIDAVLTGWERESNWTPDVIVVDYADILAPIDSRDDKREQINKTWMRLRRLSQEWHCLVLTATQSDAAGASAHTLGRSNFSEDKRKRAHVTGSIGLNQTADENENQLMRLNWIVRREAAFSESRCVHVAGCLAIANPAIKSTF